jgi:oligopeptide/dipeptide ABC transporter ATP-binding protein
MSELILQTFDVKKYFPLKKGLFSKNKGILKAIDGVSIKILKGKTLGLVGESGCGKSTLARILLMLIKPTEGKVYFKDSDITKIKGENLKLLRKKMQVIFQDPYSSLNPKLTVNSMLSEIIKYHKIAEGKNVELKIIELLDKVGLRKNDARKYPHEFSGGQRQRICIARALSLEPEFIICDEPLSALDLSVQAQIINLLIDLQKDMGLTYLFISHDLSVVKHICDSICIMYLGKIVEEAVSEEIFIRPKHPYTEALLTSVLDPFRKRSIKSEYIKDFSLPAKSLSSGCNYEPKCIKAFSKCSKITPELYSVDNHKVSCLLYNNKIS